jgi:AcrR family transcriptional regulator
MPPELCLKFLEDLSISLKNSETMGRHMTDLSLGTSATGASIVADTAATAAPRRYKPEETRQRILMATAELFARKSYDKTSTADIAQEAGVAEGSIFYHFGSKRGLLVALGRNFAEQMVAAMRGDSLDLADLEAGLMVERCFDFCGATGKGPHLMGLDEHAAEAEPYLSASRTVVVDFVEQCLRAVMKDGSIAPMDVSITASLSFAAVHDALHRLDVTTDANERDRIKRETIRFVRAACAVPAA